MPFTISVDRRDKVYKDPAGQQSYVNVSVDAGTEHLGGTYYRMESDGSQYGFERRIEREARALANKYAGTSGHAKVTVSDIVKY